MGPENNLRKKNLKQVNIHSSLWLMWIILLLFFSFFTGCSKKGRKPPSPNIIATYDGGEITVENVENYLEKRAKGLKVLVGDTLVPLMDQIPKEKEVYRGFIEEMVLDEVVKQKVKEKQLDNRGNIRHSLKHIEDELTLDQLHTEIHEKDRIPVNETEIQKYYDDNRGRFGERSFYEVRDEIKNILASQKEDDYVENYISELRDVATITKNYEILRILEPTEEEVWERYENNKELYKEPEKWVIEQIEIAGTNGKAEDEAQKAWALLGSGESFEAVSAQYDTEAAFRTLDYVAGVRGEAFDQAVTSLNPGEFSKPVQEGEKYFIVRLKEIISASFILFDIVKDKVRRSLMDEREKEMYEENKNKTLFTLHGRRFTLDDFYQEFRELPPFQQEKYRTYEQKVKLVNNMIERLLLLEDSYDRMLDAKKKEEIEHVREDILKQALHEEEVDQILEVSDEEVNEFYKKNKKLFKTLPQLKISIIMVHGGEGEEDKRAKEKIQETFEKIKSGPFKKGMTFEEAAMQYSEDQLTAQNGGKIDDWISETNDPLYELFNHPLHEKFMDLKEGEITEPFSVEQNYFIVKVRERQKPRRRSFEEVKEHLREDLRIKKHDELTAKMYRDMIDQSNLVIYTKVLETIIRKQEEVSNSQ